ncbi:MAG: hypothetical protein ACOC46_01120 [Pirellulales bacterium]
MPDDRAADWLADWTGRIVVVDVRAPYVYIGVMRGRQGEYLALEDAEAHDLRDSTTTRELYVLDTRRHGVRRNRKRVLVRLDEVVAVSLLEEVVDR